MTIFAKSAMTKGLNIHEYFEIITKKGVEPHKILEAVENGETLEQFITKTSTGKDVLHIDNFTDIWDATKKLYEEIKQGGTNMIFEKSDIIEEQHTKVPEMKLCSCGAKLEFCDGDWLHPPKEIQLSVYKTYRYYKDDCEEECSEGMFVFVPNGTNLEDIDKWRYEKDELEYNGKIIATKEFIDSLNEHLNNEKVWYETRF